MTNHTQLVSRRAALTHLSAGAVALLAAGAGPQLRGAEPAAARGSFRYCLNTATIRGQKLGLVKEIEVAAQAGYDGIEPWIGTIEEYVKGGGKLGELKTRLSDLGLSVESAIGFAEWIVDDDTRRAKGLERAKADMDLVAQLGGKRIAAPPSGATDKPGLDLLRAAERYRALLEIGSQVGVVPHVELWGFSKNLHRIGQCVAVALEANHPKAAVLLDIYHIYKGGSEFRALQAFRGDFLQVLHMNDYPNEPAREQINDSHRVFPGDGTAPVTEVLRTYSSMGGQKVLSLELFNRTYWQQPALDVAKAGLAKMKEAVAAV